MAPIRAIVCAKIPAVTDKMMNMLQPEVEVLHISTTLESGQKEIPALLRGDGTAQAVIVGGGFKPDEFDAIRWSDEVNKTVVWLRADMAKQSEDGKPPPQEEIKERVWGCFREHGVTGDSQRPGAGEVWVW